MLSLLLTVLVVEFFFRWFYPIPYSIEINMYFMPDEFTGFRLKPDSIGHYQDNIPAVANSRGHRDQEFDLEKKPGVFRILVLGDSFTVGANVREEQAYPQILENLLNGRSQRRVEVINSAVGGWDPFQYAQYYEYYGKYFQPDLVLVGFFVGNDTYAQLADVEQTGTAVAGRRVSRKEAASKFIRTKIWFYENFHVARLILTKTPKGGHVSRQHCRDFTRQYIAIQTRRMSTHLKRDQQRFDLAKNAVFQILRIKKVADSYHVPVIVVLIPDENQINPDLQRQILKGGEVAKHDFEMPQSMLIEMLQNIGISHVINLLPEFKKHNHECMYMNDTHLAPSGHELAAKILFEQIKPYLRAPSFDTR